MSISWTKYFGPTDDGSILSGEEIQTLQDDISNAVTGSLPTPGVSDGLRIPRVLSDHSGYELISQIPIAAGGTGVDMSTGTVGYAVVSQGTALTMAFSPLYGSSEATFLFDSTAQTVYTVAPCTGNLAFAYVNNFVAARGATYTVTKGSAGVTMATATVASTGVAGLVTTMTLGTVAVTMGDSIGITRTAQGTTGASMCKFVFIKTP